MGDPILYSDLALPPTTEASSSLRGLPRNTGLGKLIKVRHTASCVYVTFHGKRGFADESKVMELKIGRISKLLGEPNLITLKAKNFCKCRQNRGRGRSRRDLCTQRTCRAVSGLRTEGQCDKECKWSELAEGGSHNHPEGNGCSALLSGSHLDAPGANPPLWCL